MSEEVVEGDGPGLTFMNTFIRMEEVLEQFKLLEYETDFCEGWNMKPFSRHYFAIATNPGEQFYAFTSIVAWLLGRCGTRIERPQEYDDPNATISEILNESRALGVSVDFPPAKLKTGNGEQVIYLLYSLAEKALAKQGWVWEKPEFTEEDEPEESVMEDETELIIDNFDEPADEAEEEIEEDDSYMQLGGIQKQVEELTASKPESVLEAKVDANEWKLEVERVLPLLKVHIRTDNKDWRHHYEQMQNYSEGINVTLQETKTQLDKLHAEISKTLEKIASREKYINNQLEHLIQNYRLNQDQLAQVKEQYESSSGGVNELTQQLAQVSDELEQVKQQMEERGNNMTDSGPLVRIKKALAGLTTETKQMEIRIGVLEHSILQMKLREKIGLEAAVNKISGENDYQSASYI